jgi:hypothetical protein
LVAEVKYIFKQKFDGKENSLDSGKIEKLIVETYKNMPCSDILPLLIAYFKIYTEGKESSGKLF